MCEHPATRPAAASRAAVGCALVLSAAVAASPAWGQASRVDLGPGNVPANAPSYLPVVSFDGRYTAFVSFASNLVVGDTDGTADFFRYDRATQSLVRGDITLPLGAGEYPSPVALSHDGRWLLFNDLRGDWVAGDTNQAFDAFLYDFTTGAVRRVSVATGGAQGEGASFATSMTPDARYVAFESSARTLGPPALDNGPALDVFVHDTQTGVTIQVSHGAGGGPADGASSGARLSPDGEWVAFVSTATNLAAVPDRNALADPYLSHWTTGAVVRVTPDGVEPNGQAFAASVSAGGASVAIESTATNLGPAVPAGWNSFVWDRLGGPIRHLPDSRVGQAPGDFSPTQLTVHGHYATRVRLDPTGVRRLFFADLVNRWEAPFWSGLSGAFGTSGDGRVVVFAAFDGIYLQQLPAMDGLMPTGDADGDGLPNLWEEQVGLAASSGDGEDGALGDPDHDGVTNAAEFAAGTHPRGVYARYLAEGVDNAFFRTRLALLNPGPVPAHAFVRALRSDGTPLTERLEIPPFTRRTIEAGQIEGLVPDSFSTTVESDRPLAVDRTTLWDARAYGGQSETSVAAPSTTWYLAEGSTAGSFDLFYLIENPNDVVVDAHVTWMLPPPLAPVEHTYALPPLSRTTLYVDQADVRLASTDAAATIAATLPIFVERAMYWSRPELPFAAGHGAAAVPSPSTRWLFAEGATGSFFETFILLLNPQSSSTSCTLRFLATGGGVVERVRVLPPASRTTIWVDMEDVPGLGRALANASFSTDVTCTAPVVAERAMWWPDGDWQEAHATAGATAPASRWAIADGDDVAARTYVLVANTSAAAGLVRVTLFFEDGSTAQQTFGIAAHARLTVDTLQAFPMAAGRRFGALIDATGDQALDLIVERATYWNAEGVFWAGGTNALATPWP